MKILQLRFCNLNSLKGEFEIKFDENPIANSGLFAITGPTGAGKTTILDAITLALYRKVPRDRNFNIQEVMTRHTGECWSELSFRAKGKNYRARWDLWKARRKADGEFQNDKWELVDEETGKPIESHRKSDVQAKIEEITGLDYKRFLRSVLLAQGEFAAFLKADANERAALLERLSGIEIYSQISQAAYARHKQEQEKLQKLQEQIAYYQVLNLEERKLLEQQIEALQAQQKQQKSKQETLTTQIEWRQQLHAFHQKQQQLESEIEAVQAEIRQSQSAFQQLALHQKALPLQADLRALRINQKQEQETQQKLQSLTSAIPSRQQTIETLKQQIEQQEQQQQAQESAYQSLKPQLDQWIRLEEQSTQQHKQLSSLNQHIHQIQEKQQQNQKKTAQVSAKQKKDEHQLANTQNWLKKRQQDENLAEELKLIETHIKRLEEYKEEEAELLAEEKQLGASIKKESEKGKAYQFTQSQAEQQLLIIQNKRKELKQELEKGKMLGLLNDELLECYRQEGDWQKLKAALEEATSYQTLWEATSAQVQAINQELSGKQTKLEGLRKDLASENEQFQTLEKLYEMEKLVMHYEEARNQLEEDEACPLCGSIHHPFVTDGHQAKKSQTAYKLADKRAELKQLEKQLQKLGDERIRLEEQRKNNKQQLDDWEGKKRKQSRVLTDLRKELKAETITLKQIPALLEANRAEQAKLKQAIEARKQLEQAFQDAQAAEKEYEVQLQKARNQLQKHQANVEKLHTQAEQITKQAQQLQRKTESQRAETHKLLSPYVEDLDAPDLLSELQKRGANYQDHQAEATKLREMTKDQAQELKQLQEKQREWLAERGRLQAEKEQLDKQQAVLEAQIEGLKEQTGYANSEEAESAWQQKLQSNRASLHQLQQDFRAQQEALQSLQHQLVEQQHHHQKLQQQTKEQNQSLQTQLKARKFESLEAVEQAILPNEEAEATQAKKTQLEQQFHRAEHALTELLKQIQQEEEKELTLKKLDELQAEWKELEEKRELLAKEMGALSEKQEEDERKQKQVKQLREEEAKQQQEQERWAKLNHLIGSAKGDRFRRYAQSLTLANLVHLANRHLQKLNDRYRIKMTEEDVTSLELKILDIYQAGAVRPMQTLSGGESFLVSLALALGLSQLAGQDTQIESLFIDEGFGTLDSNSLDVAVSTLENLQAEGKTIGVISHVEALKERITTQIQVQKLSGGISRINIIP